MLKQTPIFKLSGDGGKYRLTAKVSLLLLALCFFIPMESLYHAVIQIVLFVLILAFVRFEPAAQPPGSRKRAHMEIPLEEILGNIDAYLYSYDISRQKIVAVSPSSERLHGYPFENFVKNPDFWLELIYPDDVPLLSPEAIRSAGKAPYVCSFRIIHASGAIKWVDSRMYSEFDDSGSLLMIKGILLDMTGQKAAEEVRKKDLELATLVQQSVLSPPLRNDAISILGKYAPSHYLGGDMYAWYQLDDHRYGIIIIDVMGSGVASSLISMSIRSLLEGIIRKCKEPEIVIKELNVHMYKLFRAASSPKHFFFTALYTVIDTERKCLEYINAGHTSGFVVVADKEVKELGSTCVPIGLIPELQPMKQTLHYAGPARLVLYTDGLIESPGVSMKLKQEELKAMLRAGTEVSLPLFLEQMLQIKGKDCPNPDDVCMVGADL